MDAIRVFKIKANIKKTEALDAALLAYQTISKFGGTVSFDEETAEALREPFQQHGESDCIIIIGGDGTILRSCAECARNGIPMLGINLGKLGYLSEIEVLQLDAAIGSMMRANYTIERRMMLETRIDGKEYIALNDFVIYKGAHSNTVGIRVTIAGNTVFSVIGDGLVISSPTGSTAYSLSAGGPIISPDSSTILLTPVSPHALSIRPLIVNSSTIVEITALHGEASLACDGQPILHNMDSDRNVKISASVKTADFIRLGNKNYFELLRHKLF